MTTPQTPVSSEQKSILQVGEAILVGHLFIQFPAAVITAAVWIGILFSFERLIMCLIFLGSLVLNLAWWFYMTPQWRQWAFRNGISVEELEKRADRIGLFWPEAPIFTKAELKAKENGKGVNFDALAKFLSNFRRVSPLILVILPLLVVLYRILLIQGSILWNVIPFPVFLQLNQIFLPTVAFSFWLFYPALLAATLPLSNPRKELKLVFLFAGLVIGVPFCCLFSYFAIHMPETITSEAQFDHQHFFITTEDAVSDPWTFYAVYKCNENDLECEKLYDDVGGASRDPTRIVIDQNSREIHFFRKQFVNSLMYTYGSLPHEYNFEGAARIDQNLFDLYSYKNQQIIKFVITKCDWENHSSVSCEVFPFYYSTTNFTTAEIIESTSQEILVRVNSQLILIFDKEPHCLVENCTIPGR